MKIPDFSFEQDNTDQAKLTRELISDIVEAFEKLDDLFLVREPSQMLVAYRTIKIGQTVQKALGDAPDKGHWELVSEVIRTVLVDYPIGKEI